jgi:D-3-phosphoglycerate dehydrogenase
LSRSLHDGKIAGAALDVFVGEPLTTWQPLDAEIQKLATLPNVIATPHIGYNTKEAYERLGADLSSAIRSCLDGKPVHVVN